MSPTARASRIGTMGAFVARPFKAGLPIHRLGGQRQSSREWLVGSISGRLRIADALRLARNLYLGRDDHTMRADDSCAAYAALRHDTEPDALTHTCSDDETTPDYALMMAPSLCSWGRRMRCSCA